MGTGILEGARRQARAAGEDFRAACLDVRLIAPYCALLRIAPYRRLSRRARQTPVLRDKPLTARHACRDKRLSRTSRQAVLTCVTGGQKWVVVVVVK